MLKQIIKMVSAPFYSLNAKLTENKIAISNRWCHCQFQNENLSSAKLFHCSLFNLNFWMNLIAEGWLRSFLSVITNIFQTPHTIQTNIENSYEFLNYSMQRSSKSNAWFSKDVLNDDIECASVSIWNYN